MRKHFAFPPVEDYLPWKDTAGNVVGAADGQSAESRSNASTSVTREGIDRRNAWFQGAKPKPVRTDDTPNPQEAETIPVVSTRDEMRKGVMKMMAERDVHEQEAEEASRAKFQRNFAFGDKGGRRDDGLEVHKQGDFVSAQSSKVATLRDNPLQTTQDAARSVGHSLGATSERRDKLVQDMPGSTREAGTATGSTLAVEAPHDKDETLDLVLDILADHGLEAPTSHLASQVVDLASRLRQELRATSSSAPQSHLVQSADQTNTVQLHARASLTDDAEGRISSDLQRIVDHATSPEWKSDPVLQQRAGMWALHVAAKRTGMHPQAIQQGFKQKSVEALGRLALQVLSTSNAKQLLARPTFKSQGIASVQTRGTVLDETQAHTWATDTAQKLDPMFSQRDAPTEPLTRARVRAALSDMQSFFGADTTQTDMQIVQDGIRVDTTADEVFDAFLETLRNDDLDESAAASRWDAFQTWNASSDIQARASKRGPADSLRSVHDAQKIQARAGSGHTVRFRTDMDGVSLGDESESRNARASFGAGKVSRAENTVGNITALVLGSAGASQTSESTRTSEVGFSFD